MLHVPESGILAEMYGNHNGVLYSADICPRGVLDTLCAICAAGQHVVLLFKTQERGNAGKKHASGHLGSARSLIQVQNGYAASISRAVS